MVKQDKRRSSIITNKKTQRFTILELLVVIAIMGVLMALLLPIGLAVHKNAKKLKVKEMAKAIASAICEYEAEYMCPPFDISDVDDDIIHDDEYEEIIIRLSGGNARGISFLLDVPEGDEGYVDIWSNNFIIGYDKNGDEEITVPGYDITVKKQALAFSKGPDGNDSDGGNAADDICSWKE